MTELIKTACDYLSELYDVKYSTVDNAVFINANDADFKFNLSDGERFGLYTLFHKNHVKSNQGWHIQIRSKSIFRILFFAFGHDFHKYNDIWIKDEDIIRFKDDVYKIYNRKVNAL